MTTPSCQRPPLKIGMCAAHVARAGKDNQSLLPRGELDYNHCVKYDITRLLSLPYDLILRAADALMSKWSLRVFRQHVDTFKRAWIMGEPTKIECAGLGALGIPSPNHNNSQEGGWPLYNIALAGSNMAATHVMLILINFVLPHHMMRVDLAHARGAA